MFYSDVVEEDGPMQVEPEGNESNVIAVPINVKFFCAVAPSLTSDFTFQSEELE
jgi:hypothetical protein